MRLAGLFGIALLASLFTPAAYAGDASQMQVIGFTSDGRVFAFEEYGVQDGSGFPYSYRYYIDTNTDKFLPNTPIRVRIEDENATVDQARDVAFQRGEKVLKEAQLARNQGFLAGYNAITEVSADPYRMAVNPRLVVPPVDDVLEFRLEEINVGQLERCQGLGDPVGFRLLKIDASDGGVTELIHEDASIPLSRGCPTGYRIGAVQTLHRDNGRSTYAVMISVINVGFEGPDHRWMAVTGKG